MKIIRFSLSSLPSGAPLTLALGSFDGMHRGHQKLLLEAALRAEHESGVLLFDFPVRGKERSVLTSTEDKLSYASKLHIDSAYVLEIDESFWDLSPADFIFKVLKAMNVEAVVVGEDFRFGKGAKGDVALLEKHFKVIRVEDELDGKGAKISSSAIKEMVRNGEDVKAYFDLLGHPYEVSGTIVEGLHNGRKLGFPTANMSLSAPYVYPSFGVYGGVAYLRNKPYRALINVGMNPTIGKIASPIIEVHLIGLEEEVYGESLRLAFVAKERGERKFASFEELKAQIQKDYDWAVHLGR